MAMVPPAGLLARGFGYAPDPPSRHHDGASGVMDRALAAHSCGGSRGFGQLACPAFPFHAGGEGRQPVETPLWIGPGAIDKHSRRRSIARHRNETAAP